MEILDGDTLRLTQAVAAVFGLRVIGRDPVEVLEDDVGSRRQRNADTAGESKIAVAVARSPRGNQ